MIVLFTDFGLTGPYTGQVKAALHRLAPGAGVIDLFADAPAHNPMAAAYLLAAYVEEFPAGTVFLCVVDPGVGGDRAPGVLWADGRWYVGPDNGLFEIVARRARLEVRWWEITWRPERLSATFHGRDIFAPVAARIATESAVDGISGTVERPVDTIRRHEWPDDLHEIVYIDGFGNSITGLRASIVPSEVDISISHTRIKHARTFSDVSPGQAFWYEGSNGSVVIAVNQDRADRVLGLKLGTPITITTM